ncbi:MAG: hypothetical protein AMXMBFR16_12610 [Candidatus Uhrbacteria bacterium]
MYNVRLLLDRAGAIVERYAYDSYGRPRIRESCGRGDMNNDTKMSSGDTTRFDDANDDTIWDPRADMDDDGDVDANDETAYDLKYSDWSGAGPPVDPRQAFSDVDNPFMFQGIPHFALDTSSSATEGKLMLNHHRARFADPVTGRWVTRDPLHHYRKLRIPLIPSEEVNTRELIVGPMRVDLPGNATRPNGDAGSTPFLRIGSRITESSRMYFQQRVQLFAYLSNTHGLYADPSGLACCLTDRNCCDEAAQTGLDAGDSGGVLCCCGRKVTCSWDWKNNPTWGPGGPGAEGIIRYCTLAHEQTHLDDVDCPSDVDLSRPPFSNPSDENIHYQECVGSCAGAQCLENSIDRCGSNQSCRDAIQQNLDWEREQAANHCGEFVPPGGC